MVMVMAAGLPARAPTKGDLDAVAGLIIVDAGLPARAPFAGESSACSVASSVVGGTPAAAPFGTAGAVHTPSSPCCTATSSCTPHSGGGHPGGGDAGPMARAPPAGLHVHGISTADGSGNSIALAIATEKVGASGVREPGPAGRPKPSDDAESAGMDCPPPGPAAARATGMASRARRAVTDMARPVEPSAREARVAHPRGEEARVAPGGDGIGHHFDSSSNPLGSVSPDPLAAVHGWGDVSMGKHALVADREDAGTMSRAPTRDSVMTEDVPKFFGVPPTGGPREPSQNLSGGPFGPSCGVKGSDHVSSTIPTEQATHDVSPDRQNAIPGPRFMTKGASMSDHLGPEIGYVNAGIADKRGPIEDNEVSEPKDDEEPTHAELVAMWRSSRAKAPTANDFKHDKHVASNTMKCDDGAGGRAAGSARAPVAGAVATSGCGDAGLPARAPVAATTAANTPPAAQHTPTLPYREVPRGRRSVLAVRLPLRA